MTPSYAGVYLLDAPFAIDRVYDYVIPRSLCDVVHRGSFVTVPFGNGNRKRLALVADIKDTSPFPKLKPILAVSTDRLSLSEHMMGLALFMKEQTLCTVGDAVRAMIPTAALTRMTEVYLPAPGGERLSLDAAHPEDEEILAYVRAAGTVATARLRRKFGSVADEALRRLRERRIVLRDAQYKDVDAASYTTCRRLALPDEQVCAWLDGAEKDPLRSDKQRAVLRILFENNGPMSDKELCAAAGCTQSVLSTLTEKGYIAEHKQKNERRPYDTEALPKLPPISLNEEQRQAYLALCDFVDDGEPHAALLHGVTGSGKTSVMLALISHLLGSGKSAIVLLPEIALTPQSIAIFCARFGECVAVIHSGLSAGERYDAYERIREGKATVVVGTRSAVFAPVKNLGAIIIDEEQEHTYKSDMSPKYRAHDIARYRCAQAGALMLLASATPSLESYHKAVEGKYTLIKLSRRYGKAVLPEVILADTVILAHAPAELKAAGFGDMVAKYIGVLEWKFVHMLVDEYYCPAIADMTMDAVRKMISLCDRVQGEDPEAAGAIMEALVLSGLAMKLAKSSRPASGAEHTVSHYLECYKLVRGVWPEFHGKKVGVATVHINRMYHNLARVPQITPTEDKIDMDALRGAFTPGQMAEVERLIERMPMHLVRPERLRQIWPDFRRLIEEFLPSDEQLTDWMRRAGAVTEWEDVHVTRELLEAALRFHPFMRYRLMPTRLLPMMGLDILDFVD